MADWSAVYLRQVSLATPSIAALGFAGVFIVDDSGAICRGSHHALHWDRSGCCKLDTGWRHLECSLAILIPHTWFVIVGFGCVGAGLAALIPTLFRAAGQTAGVSPAVAIATVATTGYFGFLSGAPVIGFASGWISLRWADVARIRRMLCRFGSGQKRRHNCTRTNGRANGKTIG